jgi:hypothetical protein
VSLTAAERETIISFSDDSATAHVYTSQRRIITKLTRNPSAKLIESGEHDGSAWARFTMPSDLISFRRPRNLSDSDREARRERGRILGASRVKTTTDNSETEDNLVA